MNANPAKVICLGLLVLLAFAASPEAGLLLSVVLLAAGAVLRTPKAPTTHGSARLGTLADAKEGGLLSEHAESVVLGRATWLGEGASTEQLLKLHEFTHLMTVAGTSRGKGVSIVIPNAFLWPRSLIATDKDFEVFKAVSEYRKRTYGQEQYAIDPMGMLGSVGAGFNPMAEIDGDAITLFEDAWALANLIVFRKGTEPEPHWNDAAEGVIAAFIAFVCACEKDPQRRNLITVRDLLSSPGNFRTAVDVMKQVNSHHGVIARCAWRLEFLKDRELASVLSSVNRHMNFLGSPGVARALSASSFRAADLRTETGASVYLPIVPGHTSTMGQFNRVVIGSLIRAAAAALPSEQNKVLAILDETAQLGRVPALQEATVLFRSRGIRLWFIFQSLSQIHAVYGEDAQTLIDNIDTQQYFGLDTATETAKALSERIGDATVADSSTNRGTSRTRSMASAGNDAGSGGSLTSSSGVNRNWIARRVLFASEIARLPPKVSLLFCRHLPVLPVELVRYYEDKEFAACRALATPEAKPARKPAIRRVSLKGMPAGVGHFLLGLGIASAAGLALFLDAGRDGVAPAVREVDAAAAEEGPAPGEPEKATPEEEQEARAAFLARAGRLRAEPYRPAPSPPARPEMTSVRASAGVSRTGTLPAIPAPGMGPALAPGRAPAAPPDCPDPEACPHSADPVRLHVCFDPAWCPDVLRCPHIPGIYYRRR